MLTLRHKQVLVGAANGFSTKAIALMLGLSYYTVQDYRRQVIEELEARNMTHAVAIGLRRGLIGG